MAAPSQPPQQPNNPQSGQAGGGGGGGGSGGAPPSPADQLIMAVHTFHNHPQKEARDQVRGSSLVAHVPFCLVCKRSLFLVCYRFVGWLVLGSQISDSVSAEAGVLDGL